MALDLTTPLAAYLNLAPEVAGTARGDLLAALGRAVTQAAEVHMARSVSIVDYVAEPYAGNGRDILFLRHDPVVALTAVSVNGTALTVENPAVDTPAFPATKQVAVDVCGGAIVRLDGGVFQEGNRNVLVTYRAGLGQAVDGAPPPDLVQALVEWAALLFRDRDRVGIASLSQGEATTSYVRTIPPWAKLVLDIWRRPFVPSPS